MRGFETVPVRYFWRSAKIGDELGQDQSRVLVPRRYRYTYREIMLPVRADIT